MTKQSQDAAREDRSPAKPPAKPQERPDTLEPPSQEEREYDHRGVLLPRRTRVGGIIIPQ